MIINFYPNPNKPKPKTHAVPALQIGSSVPNGTTYHPSYYDFMAKKKGVTVEEYMRRDAIVKQQLEKLNYREGDSVYPYSKTGYDKYGMCKIKGIYRTYASMEDDWPTQNMDIPFLVTAHPVMRPQEVFFATVGYFKNHFPTE